MHRSRVNRTTQSTSESIAKKVPTVSRYIIFRSRLLPAMLPHPAPSGGGGGIGGGRITPTAPPSNARIRTTNMTIKDFAKNRYIWSLWCQKQVHSKTNYKSHARSPVIGQRHIVPVFGSKRPGTRGFVYCLAFNCFWRILSQSAAIH